MDFKKVTNEHVRYLFGKKTRELDLWTTRGGDIDCIQSLDTV